jgi:hypothetical protein
MNDMAKSPTAQKAAKVKLAKVKIKHLKKSRKQQG